MGYQRRKVITLESTDTDLSMNDDFEILKKNHLNGEKMKDQEEFTKVIRDILHRHFLDQKISQISRRILLGVKTERQD